MNKKDVDLHQCDRESTSTIYYKGGECSKWKLRMLRERECKDLTRAAWSGGLGEEGNEADSVHLIFTN